MFNIPSEMCHYNYLRFLYFTCPKYCILVFLVFYDFC